MKKKIPVKEMKKETRSFIRSWKGLVAAFTSIVIVAGAGWEVSLYLTRYALAEDLRQFKQSYELDKKYQRVEKLQERLWMFEREFGFSLEKANETVKQEYNQLRLEKGQLDREINQEVNKSNGTANSSR